MKSVSEKASGLLAYSFGLRHALDVDHIVPHVRSLKSSWKGCHRQHHQEVDHAQQQPADGGLTYKKDLGFFTKCIQSLTGCQKVQGRCGADSGLVPERFRDRALCAVSARSLNLGVFSVFA